MNQLQSSEQQPPDKVLKYRLRFITIHEGQGGVYLGEEKEEEGKEEKETKGKRGQKRGQKKQLKMSWKQQKTWLVKRETMSWKILMWQP